MHWQIKEDEHKLLKGLARSRCRLCAADVKTAICTGMPEPYDDSSQASSAKLPTSAHVSNMQQLKLWVAGLNICPFAGGEAASSTKLGVGTRWLPRCTPHNHVPTSGSTALPQASASQTGSMQMATHSPRRSWACRGCRTASRWTGTSAGRSRWRHCRPPSAPPRLPIPGRRTCGWQELWGLFLGPVLTI